MSKIVVAISIIKKVNQAKQEIKMEALKNDKSKRGAGGIEID